jgi:CRISPR/Cas system-associated protein endoribonuclease Cas2
MQSGIIKSIEFLEEKIEKNLIENESIFINTFNMYIDLLKGNSSNNSNSNDNDNGNDNEVELLFLHEREFVKKKIIRFVMKNKEKLRKDFEALNFNIDFDFLSKFKFNLEICEEIKGIFLVN